MSDNSGLIPVSDAQAELGAEALRTLRSAGSYLADIVGDLPKDFIGWLVGDRIKAIRAKRLVKLAADADAYARLQGAAEPEPPPLKIAIPILEAAADEDREELQDLWARLLAAAMNPNRSRLVRQRFATALRSLDVNDVLVLQRLGDAHRAFQRTQTRDIAAALNMSEDEFEVSFLNLAQVGFVGDYNSQIRGLLSLGKEFLRTVAK